MCEINEKIVMILKKRPRLFDIFLLKRYNNIMKEKYVYQEQFKLKNSEVDFKDELKISGALALMEEVASTSAEELGFGYSFIKPNGYAFMVSSVRLEILQNARVGDTVTVATWPTPPSFAVFGREYVLKNNREETLLKASSRWCLVDLNTNKILQSKVIENQDYSTYNTDRNFENTVWKIPTFGVENKQPSFCVTIANSAYDHNMHVNNTRYADYCLNCFTVDELSKRQIKSFQISYVKQCKEHQSLRFYLSEDGNEEYRIQGVNEQNEIVVISKVAFKKDGE